MDTVIFFQQDWGLGVQAAANSPLARSIHIDHKVDHHEHSRLVNDLRASGASSTGVEEPIARVPLE